MTSLIVDVRDHIGGNCYDYIDEHGIRASKCDKQLTIAVNPRASIATRPNARIQPSSVSLHNLEAE